jgi:hypothetical protein
MIIPTYVPASSSRARRAARSIARQLKDLGAVHEETARPLALEGAAEQAELKRMIDRRIVRVAKHGTYWLDRERWAECQRKQLLFAIGAILVALGLLVTVALNAPRSERHPAATTADSAEVDIGGD